MKIPEFLWLSPPILGFLWIALAIPLVLRKIRPNFWYGFRTPRTLADPELWYVANAFCGKALIAAGCATLVLWAGFAGMHAALPWSAQAMIEFLLAIELAPLGAAVAASFLFLSRQ